MNSKLPYNLPKVGLIIGLLLFLPFVNSILATEKALDETIPIGKVKQAIRSKNFSVLKPYITNKGSLYWAQCNSDVRETFSFNEMAGMLLKNLKGAEIYVNEIPGAGLIETEGWTGEYPYLYFDLTEEDKKFVWLGVCYDMRRSLDFALSRGGKDKLYDKLPQLPRRGRRVFKDELALRVRIEEILKFKAFDALKPYAIKQKLILTECSQGIVKRAQIRGTEVSSDQVIAFLKKNIGDSKEIKSAKGGSSTYLDTEGWKGEYPFVSFWFRESKKGWEWAGVSYCKSSLMHVLFPAEPRFK